MKKTIVSFIVVFFLLLLVGCGRQQSVVEKSGENVVQNRQSDENIGGPPSVNDGSLYMQALEQRSLEICGRISEERLKARCEEKVSEINAS